jgi:inosine/xanthosine triphosphate pyrophosphatase family protein
MKPSLKNSISHRFNAFNKLRKILNKWTPYLSCYLFF